MHYALDWEAVSLWDWVELENCSKAVEKLKAAFKNDRDSLLSNLVIDSKYFW